MRVCIVPVLPAESTQTPACLSHVSQTTPLPVRHISSSPALHKHKLFAHTAPFNSGVQVLRLPPHHISHTASTVLGDDPLRVLRALRFAAGLGLGIERGTEAALAAHAGGLTLLGRGREEGGACVPCCVLGACCACALGLSVMMGGVVRGLGWRCVCSCMCGVHTS